MDTVDALVAETARKASRLEEAEVRSEAKSAQVTLLSEVGRALQRTMEIDEILHVILTAVTAGHGLGFNRAFLLMVDESAGVVRGRMGVGPSHPREAELIWKAMVEEDRSLSEMLSGRPRRGKEAGRGILELAERMVFQLAGDDNIVAKSLESGKSYVVSRTREPREARSLAEILETDQLLVVPLIAEQKKLGAIVADNFVTGRRIRDEDVRLLETFASQAGLAILNASLHGKLRERVAELERAHEELTHSQLQLLRAERMLAAGGLAATLVHDLKAPVVSIGLMARAAASGLTGTSPVKETLDRIGQEVMRIEDYLKHFARSAGKAAGKPEQVNVSHLVRDALSALRAVMAESRVESVASLGHGDYKVAANKAELRQVLINLLYNSVEAMPDGGKITVSTTVEKGLVKISVADTGKGIPEELKARVFSPFFTTKAEGSGLGLVIARRTVTNYGGRISLESSEGVGTCFTIYLPVVK
ncbi:MAG TPA: ATP-binding protein [bacterium]|nr:ATP-binding protein [bacterium]